MPNGIALQLEVLPRLAVRWRSAKGAPRRALVDPFRVRASVKLDVHQLRGAVWASETQTEGLALRADELRFSFEYERAAKPAVRDVHLGCSELQVAALDCGLCCAQSHSVDVFGLLKSLQDEVLPSAVVLRTAAVDIGQGSGAMTMHRDGSGPKPERARRSHAMPFRPSLFTFELNHAKLRPPAFGTSGGDHERLS